MVAAVWRAPGSRCAHCGGIPLGLWTRTIFTGRSYRHAWPSSWRTTPFCRSYFNVRTNRNMSEQLSPASHYTDPVSGVKATRHAAIMRLLQTVLGRCLIRISLRAPHVLASVSCDFTQSFQVNFGTWPENTSQSFPSLFFPYVAS
jgi:hypothetical protein